jgi:carbon monoxide dehydrogenase subunit G
MAIEIRETFQVAAPIELVWRFVMDPNKVAGCMPGAKLEEVVDERTFEGSIKVKVGAITTSYKGRVQLTDVDERAHKVQMSAEGRETSGGMAKGTMHSTLQSLSDGQTEVCIEASVDLTGRIMQVGRGMIQGVSHQLFLQFVKRTKEQLESAPAGAGSPTEGVVPATEGPAPRPQEDEALSIVPLILKAIWSAIVGFFRRLFGRG